MAKNSEQKWRLIRKITFHETNVGGWDVRVRTEWKLLGFVVFKATFCKVAHRAAS